MAIKTNNAAVSVDFDYEDETSQNVFKVKLHTTEAFGRTISIAGNVGGFTVGDTPYMAIPAQLLIEAVDFLRENQYIESPVVEIPEQQAPAYPPQMRTTPIEVSSGGVLLPLPMPGFPGQPQGSVQQPQVASKMSGGPKMAPPRIANSKPVQSFSMATTQTTPKTQKTANFGGLPLPMEQNAQPEQVEPEEGEDDGVEMMEGQSEQDEMAQQMEKMKQEREAARATNAPKAVAKKIVKAHTEASTGGKKVVVPKDVGGDEKAQQYAKELMEE